MAAITPYQIANFTCDVQDPCAANSGNPDTGYTLPDLCSYVGSGFNAIYFNLSDPLTRFSDIYSHLIQLQDSNLMNLNWYSIPSRDQTIQFTETLDITDMGMQYKQQITGALKGRYSEYIQFFEKLSGKKANFLLRMIDGRYLFADRLLLSQSVSISGAAQSDPNSLNYVITGNSIRPAEILTSACVSTQILN